MSFPRIHRLISQFTILKWLVDPPYTTFEHNSSSKNDLNSEDHLFKLAITNESIHVARSLWIHFRDKITKEKPWVFWAITEIADTIRSPYTGFVDRGDTVAAYMRDQNLLKVLRFLVEEVHCDVSVTERENGDTPLMLTTSYKLPLSEQYLIEHGAQEPSNAHDIDIEAKIRRRASERTTSPKQDEPTQKQETPEERKAVFEKFQEEMAEKYRKTPDRTSSPEQEQERENEKDVSPDDPWYMIKKKEAEVEEKKKPRFPKEELGPKEPTLEFLFLLLLHNQESEAESSESEDEKTTSKRPSSP